MKPRIIRPNPDSPRLSLPRIGKIKIGYKNDKGYPVSVDYFIPFGNYSKLFTCAYGDRPQTIQIVFPEDDPDKVCRERYEYRNDAGQLIAYGDGCIFNVWDGKQYKEFNVEKYPKLMESISKKYPNRKVNNGEDGWNVTLTLNFIIPLVRGIAGVWTFETRGNASTIPAIRDTFDAMLEKRGKCMGILFDLNVQFAKTQKPGDKSKFPVVSLVPNESVENVNLINSAYNKKSLENKK